MRREDDGSPPEVDVPQSVEGRGLAPESSVPVRTFLIADVRGYTRYTQEHGDEEAGTLAAMFASLAREVVTDHGGELLELRGDEALSVFISAREAVRAAVDLQRRFRARDTDGKAVFPLPVGIGLDAGEAVPIEGGYRGSALNLASRLCSLAAPGQILTSETVASLTGRTDGVRFVSRRPVRLKGLEKPVRGIEVVAEPALPPLPQTPVRKRPRVTRGRAAVVALAGLALVVALVVLAVVRARGTDYLDHLDANALGAIDAEAARLTSQVSLGGSPSAITAGEGSLWVASETEGTVSHYEPGSGRIQTLTVGGSPGGLAYGAGSLWVTKSEDRVLWQINPETSAVVQPIEVGNRPGAVAVGEGAVWVVNRIDGTLSRVDLARGSVTDTIPVGPNPAGVAVGRGAVWLASEGTGRVLRIDPDSRTIIEPINVGNGPTGIAVANDKVWVANSLDGTVSRIDSATSSVSATIPVRSSPSALAADGEGVWVASPSAGTVTRIDSEEGEITETLTLGSSPSALVLADGKLWTTTLPPLTGHRGGNLRVEAEPSACRCADPAFGFSSVVNQTDTQVAGLVYDGLVAYRRVGSVAGARVVPNLAARLPALTADGKAYTFQLRGGVRYSDGTPVRASDFRFSIERLFTINPEAAPLFDGLVGATRCLSRKGKPCALSEGIEVDDKTGTIVIRLTEPDPDFLHNLALPSASVVPAGTPVRVRRARPVPGTGPYRVASLGSDRLRLVRNPHFHSWSTEARPEGYPSEIRFHLRDNVNARFDAVEKGAADWVSAASLSAERLRGALTRHGDRLHSDPEPFTFWMFLNTRVPPFDDERVREAVNYATDRGALLEQTGGTILGAVTCQIVPQGFPAYRPYCPFTRNPNPAGTWTAPDLGKARALVAASGTEGTRVEVLVLDGPQTRTVGRYFVSLLRQLGYRSSLRTFPVDAAAYFRFVADSRNKAQMGQAGLFAGILAPSTFLEPFTCAAFMPRTPANPNLSGFCDRAVDARVKEAEALQTSEPLRADELWAQVDRALVDRAVVVPTVDVRSRVFVSERVDNVQNHPLWGTLLDQMWVK